MNDIKQTSIPSAPELRAELERMFINDLLGPAGGPDEELVESPSHRYFVGILAPRQSATGSADNPNQRRVSFERPATPKDPDWGGLVDDEPTAEEILERDNLAIGGRDNSQDGTVEAEPVQRRSLIPSSMGMTFSVDAKTSELKVTARWGQYMKESSGEQVDDKNSPLRVWQRYPRGGEFKVLKLTDGPIRPINVDPHCPDVVIRGRIRKRDGHWSITLFLVNEQSEPAKNKDQAWVFQPELEAKAHDDSPVFIRKQHRVELEGTDPGVKLENQMLDMLYRKQLEFAVGHGVGVHVELSADLTRAIRVNTRVVPAFEVPKTTPPTEADAAINPAFAKLKGLELDMKSLAETSQKDYRKKLQPLLDAYEDWITREEKRIDDAKEQLDSFKDVAKSSIDKCRTTLKRIKQGLDLVSSDIKVAKAFAFANKAMWLQRTHSKFAEKVRRGEKPNFQDEDIPRNRSWYPFQVAFMLLNLPGIADLHHADRREDADAVADLLWFPTGGGKTEAYLGLTAFTLAIRRLQGEIEGRLGENGIAVLMRYTLRLLTIQQFQRAAALICACEEIRRHDNDPDWGKTPFRLGLWVGGKVTPNYTEDAAEVVKGKRMPRKGAGAMGQVGSPHQLRNCPWCGSEIDPDKHITVESFAQGQCRTLVFCGDTYGQCIFSRKKAPTEGLPIIVVDEEIYRRLPSLLITTVDKFAQMTWNGAVQTLFGQVNGYCDRHGFRAPEIEDSNSHPQKGNMPAVKSKTVQPLRPPDLIIQDELHLISGPLGTMVGLYETAIDKLCTWSVGGTMVRPKVIASTATIRKAQDQIHSLFLRRVNVFPAQGLDISDNFFSLQRLPDEKTPGRRYIGVCAPGRRQKAALIRTYVALLAAGQVLYEKFGVAADPWMTLVGYFNSLRELGGMTRLVNDDVRTRLQWMRDRGLANRKLYTPDTVKELTSRLGSTQIPEILDHMEVRWDPKEPDKKTGKQPRPLDVLMATNMLSVGVDVPRLGLMTVAGQPKSTSEYIQATSRVGRQQPGLVVTVLNWARPRDLSHYETFEHYHQTFYKHVEPLSVTPFSSGAIHRGLAALLVSLIRMPEFTFNENATAQSMADMRSHPAVKNAVETIARRAKLVAGDAVSAEVTKQVKRKLDVWQRRAQRSKHGATLGYQMKRDKNTLGLLERPSLDPWQDFTCLNSMRDVEMAANLVLDDHHMDDEPATPADEQGAES